MPQKYIKILTFLGLIAIVAVQSLWLVNTYQLIDGKIRQACSRLFPKSVLDEVADRLNQVSDSEDAELTIHLEETANIEEASGPELVSRLIVAFNHYADSVYQSTFSASALDSIFTEALAGEGIYVQVHSQVLDSVRSVNASSSLLSFKHIETQPVFLDAGKTTLVQARIVNPYWAICRQMGISLIATVFLIILVVVCLLYQVKIILRQNKIARLRQDFTYAMIHDMKTPINTITMAGHTLESGALDNKPELKRQYFSILNEESGHLLQLSERILTIAKLEQSNLKLTLAPVHIYPLLDELVCKYKVKAKKVVDFQIDCPEMLEVMADEAYLKEAVSNLIDNSLKYSHEEVQIRLSACRENGYVVIKVWDNGWGISRQQQKHIFEKFQRGGLEEKKDKRIAGFGLGLNYVYKVITAMDGSVHVDSVEGKYSEFVLVLPDKV